MYLKCLRWLAPVLVAIGVLAPVLGQSEGEPLTLTIMHTNDTHAFHEPNDEGNGGVAREATVVKQIRDEAEHSLLLDSGDRFSGSLFHFVHRGEDNAQIMNLIGYDAMGLGNHEFDDGDDVLAAFIDAIDFPVVTANIDFSASAALVGKVDPYTIIDVGDGAMVGLIGLITPETDVLSNPGDDLIFEDDVARVTQDAVDALTEQGVNKIIVLSHIGYPSDLQLAGLVSGVDIIVGGGTNTLLSNTHADAVGEYPIVLESAIGEPVLVVHAAEKTEYMGRLDATFDGDGILTDWEGDTILLSDDIVPDPAVSELVAELAEPVEELGMMSVGETSVALTGGFPPYCRIEECLLGNVITDAMRLETGVDMVIQNGGGIRADISEGEVLFGDIVAVLPFGNTVSMLELTGADVIAALENGVSLVNVDDDGNPGFEGGAEGRFPQVSGLRYTFDATQEADSRIVSVDVLVDGEYVPIDPESIYTVAVNDFMRNGGDGYTMLENYEMGPDDMGRPLEQIVADYITANSPIAPEIEGRIIHQTAE